jgi:uroporphyrinogen-III synthase
MTRFIYLLSPLIKEDTLSLPMIQFNIITDNIDFSRCDTLMFTSKQAVKSADMINPDWKKFPSLAIGSATAKQIKTLGGKVLYQPKRFYGKSLSEDIINKFKENKILYLRPKEVSFDSKSFLEASGILLQEQVIYETTCIQYIKKDKPSKHAIIIFTSPSTIHCFFKNFEWDDTYTAIVIGESTKEHLPSNVYYKVSSEATIDACIEKAKEILLSSNSK